MAHDDFHNFLAEPDTNSTTTREQQISYRLATALRMALEFNVTRIPWKDEARQALREYLEQK